MSPVSEHDVDENTTYMNFDDDEEPPSRDAASNIGLVTMKPPTYSRKQLDLKADSMTVGLELNATSSAAAREGLDLVAVLDKSDSMAEGDRIGNMRRAMQFVIMKLTEVDRLSIVAFNNIAARYCPLRCMTPAAKKEVMAIVDGFPAAGGTNIEGGLTNAMSVVTSRRHTVGRTANIFLMSDGFESPGSDARKIDVSEVPVYTFGFGKDTDHGLLSDIARKSRGGTFSSCPDGTNLSSPFAKLVGGLTTIVAQDVHITLTSELAEVETMDVSPGIDYETIPTFKTGGEKVITIDFGTIFSGESRKVIVKFKLKPSTNRSSYNATVAVAQHSYIAQRRESESKQPKNIMRKRTKKPDTCPTKESAELHAEEVRQQVAVAVREARELANAKSDSQEAAEGNLQDARYKLQAALNAVEDITLDDSEKMAGILRDELQKLIKLMASKEIFDTQGLPYALAVESSHWCQRTAGKGGDGENGEPDGLYDTTRMKTCAKQAQDFEKNPKITVPSAEEDDKEELAANPFAAVAAPLVMHLDTAIQALQAIKEILVPTS